MAHDEKLAQRVRAVLDSETGVAEKKMFGYLCFLIRGALAVAASSTGALMVRVDPQLRLEYLAEPGTAPMMMRGRETRGWILVDADHLTTDVQLHRWIDIAIHRADEV